MTDPHATETRKGWSWFERDSVQHPANEPGGGDLPDPGRELRQAYARCFGSADGKKVLAHLRAITLERAYGPQSTSDMLRHIEGQRQLVSYVWSLTEHGRQGR